MQGIFLMVVGVLWPRLRVTRLMGRAGVFLAVYGMNAWEMSAACLAARMCCFLLEP